VAAFGKLFPMLASRKRRKRNRRKLRRVEVQGRVFYVRPPSRRRAKR
jgi:hypothetical protein